MGFNLTTDDVCDEIKQMNRYKKPKKEEVEKTIVDDKGIFLFKGKRVQRLLFLKKHFNWTGRMIKRGRWKKPFKDAGYKII